LPFTGTVVVVVVVAAASSEIYDILQHIEDFACHLHSLLDELLVPLIEAGLERGRRFRRRTTASSGDSCPGSSF
jgi:hypothetical protein